MSNGEVAKITTKSTIEMAFKFFGLVVMVVVGILWDGVGGLEDENDLLRERIIILEQRLDHEIEVMELRFHPIKKR